MFDEDINNPIIYYCKKCGWRISNKEIESITGRKEKLSFCQECGIPIYTLITKSSNITRSKNYKIFQDKLSKRVEIISGYKYSDEVLTICELLYEEIGSFRGVERELEEKGIKIDRRIIKKKLEEKFLKEERNFEEWVVNYKKHQRNVHYKDSEIEEWEILYEEIGSFPEVAKVLKNRNKIGPDYSTIVKRLREKFEREGCNFNVWRNSFKRKNPSYFLPHYTLAHAKEWKNIFEKQGSYRSIEDLISVDHHTIKNYISQLAEQEGWDFEEWEEKYQKGRFKYDNDDLELWIELYEDLGRFLAVSTYLNKEIGQSPDSKTIKKRIVEEFQFRGWNFDDWVECNKKVGIYSNDDVLEWKSLYEELGNFTAVSDYLNERIGESPDPTTVKNRLFSLFQDKGWNFQKWINEYYNDNSERHYLIGKYIHWILEYIFIEFTLEQDLKGFFEIMPNRLNGSFKSVDNVLFKSPFNIINIDYTTSIRKKIVINKCKKGYQDFNRKLIIVVLNQDVIEEFLKYKNIPFKENVEILTKQEFCSFIGYYGNYLENYNDAIEIMKESYNDDFFLKKLEKLAKEARKNLDELSEIYPISQDDYELEASWWKNY